jgi:hypothetical protein
MQKAVQRRGLLFETICFCPERAEIGKRNAQAQKSEAMPLFSQSP